MRRIAIPLIALAAVACGGSSSSGPTEAVLNIDATGIRSPAGVSSIAIPTGGRVHYFNKDTVPHKITSGCTELSMATPLAAGADQVQPVMLTPESCGLNDASGNAALVASVTVNAPSPGGGGGGGSGY